jgi:ElaB/YqjD/DUF883 family membrane-anchored ribosome-binding protein
LVAVLAHPLQSREKKSGSCVDRGSGFKTLVKQITGDHMKATTQKQPQPSESMATSASKEHGAFEDGQTVVNKDSSVADSMREHAEDRGAEILDQAKRKAHQYYDRANKSVSEQFDKAIDYGRENPGKTTLIAFGVGVGVGLLLANGLSAPPRRRRHRFVGTVKNALSTFAQDLFSTRSW